MANNAKPESEEAVIRPLIFFSPPELHSNTIINSISNTYESINIQIVNNNSSESGSGTTTDEDDCGGTSFMKMKNTSSLKAILLPLMFAVSGGIFYLLKWFKYI